MDTSNELRSALSRVKQQVQDDALETLEGLREENIDAIYSWIDDHSELNDDIEYSTGPSQEQKGLHHDSPRSNVWGNAPPSRQRVRTANKTGDIHGFDLQKPDPHRRYEYVTKHWLANIYLIFKLAE
jgi:hypothetical protein